MRKKYPAELLQRRKPNTRYDDRGALNLMTGRELSAEERDSEAFVELIANRDYYDKGIS